MSRPLPNGNEIETGVRVFSREEIEFLEEEGIFQPELTTGKRKVSVVLSPPSEFSSSSSSSASVNIRNFSPSTISFDFPMNDDGVDCLEWVGFTPSAAREIFERYSGRPDPRQCPDSLMDYAFGHVSQLKLRHCKNMGLREAMSYVGLNQQIQDALSNPEFADIFWTQELHFWVRDTLELNYATLVSRQKLLKNHASRRMAHKKKQKQASLQEAFQQAGEAAGPQRVTATINMTVQDFPFPAAHVAIEPNRSILPDHVVLYKGKGFHDPNSGSIIKKDGSINMRLLQTAECEDFNPEDPAHYWTPEKDTAEQYRRWAALRSPVSETCIIEIQISKDLLNSWNAAELWYSPDWRRYVWLCKRRVIPGERFHYLFKPDQVDVVKGHICTGVSKAIKNIREENIDIEMTEDCVLKCRSTRRKAIQWAFLEHKFNQLATEIRGKMYIEIFAAPNSAQQK